MGDKISEETMAKFFSNLVKKYQFIYSKSPAKPKKNKDQKTIPKCITVKLLKTKDREL